MPAPPIYQPPAVRRYFALAKDPNSAAGGSNLETVAGDITNFPGGVIPDITAVLPVTTADFQWGRTNISRDNEVTGYRAGRPEIPFKVSPTVPFTAPAYRFAVEQVLKAAMGAEGTIGGTVAPFTHPLSPVAFGGGAQPSYMAQVIRDGINHKLSGVVIERATVNFPADGEGTVAVEAHALYAQQPAASVAMPTGVIPEPTALPYVIRDAAVVFDGGATSVIGINRFQFDYQNRSTYERQVAGHCVDVLSVGTPPVQRKLWFPTYNKISGRHLVGVEVDFIDTQEAQEIAHHWGQVQKIVVTVADPLVGTNLIRFTLYATELNGGGVGPLAATGDLTNAFTGNAYYSSGDGSDVLVEILNQTNTPI